MKHRIIAVAGALTLAALLTACGGNTAPAQSSSSDSAAVSKAESVAVSKEAEKNSEGTDSSANESEPLIIEMGDADAIEALAKQAQNFEIKEGTAVQIYGIYSEGISTPAVQEQKDDGSYIGISLYVDGDWDAPADKSEIYVEGAFQKGQYFMELHAKPENITVAATPES